MKKCPFCAEEIQAAAVVCKHCGRDQAGKTQAGGRLGWMILIVLVVVGLVVFASQFSTPDVPTLSSAVAPAAMASVSQRNPSAAQLAKIVASADETCPTATRTFFQGTDETKEEFWSVACSNGKSFMVSLKASGQTNVVSCSVMAAVNVRCFKTFESQR